MWLFDSCKSLALYLAALISFPLANDFPYDQRPLIHIEQSIGDISNHGGHTPKFPSPSTPFICEYPSLGKGWSGCSTKDDRSCWLRGPNGQGFNLSTDYEKNWPEGITREVHRSLAIISR